MEGERTELEKKEEYFWEALG